MEICLYLKCLRKFDDCLAYIFMVIDLDKHKIIKMLEYSGISYKNIQPKDPKESIVFINDTKTDIQCFIRKRKEKLVIVFRGSDSKKDWLTDFQFWKKTVPYNNFSSKIRVHSGFLNAYKSKSVRDKIHSLITKDIYKIQITGHSYGAGLATLCAVDLEYNFSYIDYEVILFGSPRVGNKAFKESYNKRVFKTIRVENGNDIVTKIPFKFLGYRHIGTKLHIGNPQLFGIISFSEHELEKYYNKLLNFFK